MLVLQIESLELDLLRLPEERRVWLEEFAAEKHSLLTTLVWLVGYIHSEDSLWCHQTVHDKQRLQAMVVGHHLN